MRTIAVINQASTVPGDDFGAALAAVQAQVSEEFDAVWGLPAKLEEIHARPGDAQHVSRETIFVLDDADQAGALGYHDLAKSGYPVGFVFARTSRSAGEDWSVTLSHEVLEQLADPWVNTLALVTSRDGRPLALALEVADPVEALAYDKKGRPVSDFVYPSWFRRGPNAGQLDFLGKVHSPLQLLPGGYIPYTQDLRTWQQIFADKVPMGKRLPHHLSRAGRRLASGVPGDPGIL